MLRYKRKYLWYSWSEEWVVLYDDSTMAWFKYEFGLRMNKLSMKCLPYVNDQVILAPSVCELQEMVIKVNDFVKKRHTKVNVSKTMVFEKGESTTE
ncbi:hypothetical protein EVAR_98466_1 [Eumeta japonica]|uniref:Reverse transcriptase domain-containing protein n=1 Tax=Eumeta variegata TaxID=151549 RepID=A0A4C1YSD6_EUMVA|nr:hypothetical protein EVAR_98466_1 [Eumeta japonica]